MTEPGEIVMLQPHDELHTCPACGYALGFHTSFISANAGKDNPIKSTREVYRVILICPECGARYDVGWRVSFTEFESRFVKAPAVPVTPPPPAAPVTSISVLPLPPPARHDKPPE
jgi:predicted RNA-binding Zn-ribbon protein involved in translation (DUF1610 family)